MTLREARKRRGLTQVELADLSGVEQTQISRIEKGRVGRPRWETVAKLSRALNYRPEAIFPVGHEEGAA
jgi:transcriptional regulator with XRE-family HTH domain